LEFCKQNHIHWTKTKNCFGAQLSMKKRNGLSNGAKWMEGRKQNVWTFDFNLLKPQFADETIEAILESDDDE